MTVSLKPSVADFWQFSTSPDHQEFISLRWLKLEQFKFNQSGTNMSDQNTKTISRLVIEFTLNENKIMVNSAKIAKDGKVSIPVSSH
ncbi:MAG: hypothetical protein ACTJLN_03010 [Rickettsia amblyommatis]